MKVKLLLSVLMLAIIIAGSVYLTRDVLRVHGVVVIGCVEREPGEVTLLSGIPLDESIFKVDLHEVWENVEKNPYYDVEDVSILYPDQILIRVHERRPRAVMQYLGNLIIMDERGNILEVRQTLGGIRCPVVSGLSINSYQVGQPVSSSDPTQVYAMRLLLEEMIAQDCTQMFSEIVLTDTEDIRMMTRDGYHIRFGSVEDVETKLHYLKYAIPEFARAGHVGGTFLIETVRSFVYQPPGTSQSGPSSWVNSADAPENGAPEDGAPEDGAPEDIDDTGDTDDLADSDTEIPEGND